MLLILKSNTPTLVILVLSLLFRITNLGLIEYKADEAINLFLTTRPIFGHGFAPGGTVSSLGITNFPLVNYLLFPLTFISLDPKIISFFIGLINSLAVVAFFLIIRRYYNQTIAFISAAIIATSPWMILFSRKIWAQDFIFPLFIPFFLSIHKIIIDKNQRFWSLYAFSSLLLIQIHQSALFFVAPLTTVMLLKRIKVNLKYLVFGTILGIIPTLHYFYFQATTGCFDCQMFLSSSQRVATQASTLLFIRPFQILNQGNFFPILGEDVIYFAKNFPAAYLFKQLYYVEYLLIPLGLFLFYKQFKKIGFIIFPVALLPFIYAFFKLEPHIHYFLIIAPFLFLFLGMGLNYFISNKNIFIKYLSLFVFGFLIIFSIYYNFSFYQTIRNQKNIKGDYGQIFEIKQKETEQKFSLYKNDPAYSEMIIASYVPYNLSHGDIGVSRMLYEAAQTRANMSKLEERLTEVPIDPRIHLELVAYYTKQVPNKRTVYLLKKKSDLNEGLLPVYEEVRNYYLLHFKDEESR